MSEERKLVSFDWAIKTILRDKANYDVLEGFLYALLKEKISITEIIESESNRINIEMKYNRVDLLATDEKGEHIIIEVQYAPERSYFKRLLYGTSKDIIDNIKTGEDYSHVKKVYSVSLIYFDVEAHKKGEAPVDYVYHGRVDFTGLHNGKRIAIDTNYLIGYEESEKDDINIFPEYFIIPITLFDDNVKDDLDEWIYAFKNSEVKETFSAPGIKEMGEKLGFVSMSPKEQRIYNRYLEDLASERGVIGFYEDKRRRA
ncbi:Rpn family recombination-promoting nuclease/putative transposase, partial [bacterium]|nr:Rpn family recombination-promoting nuclease/putative transposase [bacterium]